MTSFRDPNASREETLTDDHLTIRINQGDARALSRLASRHIEKMKVCAVGILHDDAVAEAVAWETIEWVWENRERWHPQKVGAFLWKATKSRALNRLRKEKSERARTEKWAREERRRPRPPDRIVERWELRTRMERAINALPARQREAFVLTRIEGFSYSEAGEQMRVSRRTVEHQVEAATAKLRRLLEPLRSHRSMDRGVER